MQDYRDRQGPNTMNTRYANKILKEYKNAVSVENEETAAVLSGEIPTMKVKELQELLGLKKTDSYWLVKKNCFKSYNICGSIRIDKESFEYWYAGQIKYKKVNGPPPGERLRQESYDADDISKMLRIGRPHVYEVMKHAEVPCIIVDYWKRWPKKAFDAWYANQTKYCNEADQEQDQEILNASITMPEMAWLLGIDRKAVYSILNQNSAKDILKIFRFRDRRRILKESFQCWLSAQSKYKLAFDSVEEGLALLKKQRAEEQEWRHLPKEVGKYFRNNKEKRQKRKADQGDEFRPVFMAENSANPDYYTVENVMLMLGIRRPTLLKQIRAKKIPAVAVANSYRIPKAAFDQLLPELQKQKGKEKKHGKHH